MGVFGKLLARIIKGNYCACCGSKVQIDSSGGSLFGMARSGMDFSDIAKRALHRMKSVGYVCEKCGAAVCKGCSPLSESPRHWKNFPQCPVCGSDMRRL